MCVRMHIVECVYIYILCSAHTRALRARLVSPPPQNQLAIAATSMQGLKLSHSVAINRNNGKDVAQQASWSPLWRPRGAPGGGPGKVREGGVRRSEGGSGADPGGSRGLYSGMMREFSLTSLGSELGPSWPKLGERSGQVGILRRSCHHLAAWGRLGAIEAPFLSVREPWGRAPRGVVCRRSAESLPKVCRRFAEAPGSPACACVCVCV